MEQPPSQPDFSFLFTQGTNTFLDEFDKIEYGVHKQPESARPQENVEPPTRTLFTATTTDHAVGAETTSVTADANAQDDPKTRALGIFFPSNPSPESKDFPAAPRDMYDSFWDEATAHRESNVVVRGFKRLREKFRSKSSSPEVQKVGRKRKVVGAAVVSLLLGGGLFVANEVRSGAEAERAESAKTGLTTTSTPKITRPAIASSPNKPKETLNFSKTATAWELDHKSGMTTALEQLSRGALPQTLIDIEIQKAALGEYPHYAEWMDAASIRAVMAAQNRKF